MPRPGLPFLQDIIQVIEGYIIVYSPGILVLRQREIYIGSQFLVTAAQQVTLHVGEVDVTPVQEIGLITFFHQFLGQGG